jgi:hypothetical protein
VCGCTATPQDDDWEETEEDEEEDDAASGDSDSLVIHERYEKKLRNVFGAYGALLPDVSASCVRLLLASLELCPLRIVTTWVFYRYSYRHPGVPESSRAAVYFS